MGDRNLKGLEDQGLEDTESYFKGACEISMREGKRLRQEQEAIDSMSKKLKHVHFPSTVKLNVGGHQFTTSLQTLTKDPNSKLAAMFSGKFEMKPSEDGTFFIDRDGTHFRFILNYLRNGELILPEGATFLKEIEVEAKFYQIQGILDELKPKHFEESVILMNEIHRNVLKGWLPSLDGKWCLLFRASRDGFASETFHSKCDHQGPTVTIVKSKNNIFGGFTEVSWTSYGLWTVCSQAFLFSIVNPHGLEPTKLPLTKNEHKAIYCGSSYGPVFGGSDLYISRNTKSDTTSYSNLGSSYECPSGKKNKLFTGRKKFSVTDYEVFGLQK